MKYNQTVTEIKNILTKNKVWFETFEHEAVRTSEEAARVRTGYALNQGAKAIIVRIKENESSKYFLMLVLPADKRFDTAKVKKLLNAKDVRFATEEEVIEVTKGVKPGGVPPFGNIFGLTVITDTSLFDNEKIIFNAGDRSYSIAMNSSDYRKIVKPKIESIV